MRTCVRDLHADRARDVAFLSKVATRLEICLIKSRIKYYIKHEGVWFTTIPDIKRQREAEYFDLCSNTVFPF